MTTTTGPGLILAIDLGKYKSLACLYQGDPANARFDSFTTDRQHLRQLFARKLLVRCWALLRDKKPWRAEPAAKAA
jgi:hypothetical protein